MQQILKALKNKLYIWYNYRDPLQQVGKVNTGTDEPEIQENAFSQHKTIRESPVESPKVQI